MIKRKIENIDPIQWAAGEIETLLYLGEKEAVPACYWEQLLLEKRREVWEDYLDLAPGVLFSYFGVYFGEGWGGGKALAMRIMLSLLPDHHRYAFPESRRTLLFNKERLMINFREALDYLNSLFPAPEKLCSHWKEEVLFGLKRGKLPPAVAGVISRLEALDAWELLLQGTQGEKEVFANLFAVALLKDTERGKQLLGHLYHKIEPLSELLSFAFTPLSLCRNSLVN